MNKNKTAERIPSWIKKKISVNENYYTVKNLLKDFSLHTVCESAVCPNIYECFKKKYVTFMILGNVCTRNCKFCGVTSSSAGKGTPIDRQEPEKIAKAVKKLGLKYAVITSVTRDDLPDKGAEHFAEVTRKIKELSPQTGVELLIPDFGGEEENFKIVADARPDVISHNIETVASLYLEVRPQADYKTSLKIVHLIKEYGFPAKSGFMLGLGEKREEIFEMMADLKNAGCEYLVIGQYLKSSPGGWPVKKYFKEPDFQELAQNGKNMGFKNVFAGIFYRSSYMAEKLIKG
jgi:lipoyl synthase